MNSKSKTWAILFLATAVLSLILLASSLSTVETAGQRPLVRLQPVAEEEVAEESANSDESRDLSTLRQSLTVILTALLVAGGAYVIWRISKLPAPRQRRQSFGALSFIILFLALYLATDGFANLGFNGQDTRPILFVDGPTLAFAFFVGLVPLTVLGAYIFIIWRKSHISALEQLALEADETVAEVEAGGDIRNAVISCYHRMCLVLQEERRMVRQEGMTPREFASRLEGVGLPHKEVVNLTRLFEAVRYGAHEFNRHEEKQALACLKAIREAAINYQPPPRKVPWATRSAQIRS